MNMGNKVSEWQAISLKKDIEKILKFLKERRTIEFTLTFDVEIALLALFLNIIDKDWFDNCKIIIIALIIISIVLTVLNYVRIGLNTFINRYRTYNSFSKNELVDLFDNDICYCIMTANSYYKMLKGLPRSKENNHNLFKFYYIETWYYINKAKYQLQRMIYKEKDIFTDDPVQIVNRNMISITRLVNIIKLIDSIQKSIEKLVKNNFRSSDEYNALQAIHIRYDTNYFDFIKKISESFDLNGIDITRVGDLYKDTT